MPRPGAARSDEQGDPQHQCPYLRNFLDRGTVRDLEGLAGRRFQLAISPPILDEYRRVLEFLEAAVAAGADYVVTGDVALLRVARYQSIQIVRPKQVLKTLFG